MGKWPNASLSVTLAVTCVLPSVANASAVVRADLPLGINSSIPSQATLSQAATVSLADNARAAVLMNMDTRTIMFEKNSHERLPPASVTKIMTMLLVMEEIDKGKLKFNEKVATSKYAASMGGSQIFLAPGEEMTVEEMLKGIAMASGNDASVAMAEKIAGSESAFVQKMNDRAQELGMKNTHFVNSSGLPAENHYTSAYDIALMSQQLLNHPIITKFTGAYEDFLRQNTRNKFWLVNTNKLVRFYQGADGLKTGFTSEAKYCLSATAKRNDMRVIAVVLGEPNTKIRNAEVTQMFDYAFAQYQNVPLLKRGDYIGHIQIENGVVEKLDVKAQRSHYVLLKKGENPADLRFKLEALQSIKAPIKVGQPLGKLVIYQGDKVLHKYAVESTEAIAKAGWWISFKRMCSKLFFVN